MTLVPPAGHNDTDAFWMPFTPHKAFRADPRLFAGADGAYYVTEDGPLEVYPVLESRLDAAGSTWVRVRLPMRSEGRTGWVPRDDLGPLHVVRTLLRVNRTTLRATLYRDGRRIWSSAL